MADMLLVGGVLLTCIIIIALAITTMIVQHRDIERLQAQQHAWETAQDVQRKRWEASRSKQFATLEKTLLRNVEEAAELERQRIQQNQARIKSELDALPHIEDTPLPLPNSQDHAASASSGYEPRDFQDADLAHTNLSYRYLRNADLRNANLSHANLFMADLTGACLRGADLSAADLSATNLSATDLTGATLLRANMLVTDLNNAILVGANLLHARHLTAEQIHQAVIDNTTRLDDTIDITRPRHPRIPLI